jgi:hypothetical protein
MKKIQIQATLIICGFRVFFISFLVWPLFIYSLYVQRVIVAYDDAEGHTQSRWDSSGRGIGPL